MKVLMIHGKDRRGLLEIRKVRWNPVVLVEQISTYSVGHRPGQLLFHKHLRSRLVPEIDPFPVGGLTEFEDGDAREFSIQPKGLIDCLRDVADTHPGRWRISKPHGFLMA